MYLFTLFSCIFQFLKIRVNILLFSIVIVFVNCSCKTNLQKSIIIVKEILELWKSVNNIIIKNISVNILDKQVLN